MSTITTVIFYTVIGAFIGWNLPQPKFAKDFQDKVVSWIKRSNKE